MPYALCPMPYARQYLMLLRKAIGIIEQVECSKNPRGVKVDEFTGNGVDTEFYTDCIVITNYGLQVEKMQNPKARNFP